jgi:hypothetical protein
MEENFWSKKTFISHINFKWLLGNIVDSIILSEPFVGIGIEFCEFFLNIRANIAILFLKSC